MENNDAEPIILDQIANYNFQELEKNIACRTRERREFSAWCQANRQSL